MRRLGPDLWLRLALYFAFVLFAGWHLGRLERGPLPRDVVFGLAIVALAPALATRLAGRWFGIAALVPAVVLGLALATSDWPQRPLVISDGSHRAYVAHVGSELWSGLEGWFTAALPYDATRYPGLRSLALLVAFGTLLLLARWLVARPRPVLAILVALIPFAITSIVFQLPYATFRAVLYLAFALAVLALGDRSPQPGVPVRPSHHLLAGAAVVVLAVLVVALPGISRGAALPWQDWKLIDDVHPVSVTYVWNHTYKPLKWPSERTEVLVVTSPRPAYWRAVVLNDFDGTSWRRGFADEVRGADEGDAVPVDQDGVPPPRDTEHVDFEVRGLDEPYLLSAGQPAEYRVPKRTGGGVLRATGVFELLRAPRPGTHYSVEAVLRDPTDTDLRGAGTDYPTGVTATGLRPFFNDAGVPRFGAKDRAARMQLLFAQWDGDPQRAGWREAYDRTLRITEGARTPLDAVRRIEIYFRSRYRYDESASLRTDQGPPLPSFILRGDAGYCQMFSGSMATMLRLLGIPARVAEGFTQGTRDDGGRFHVTDRNAHAWVEVYFPGFGWQPFDPTPTRGLATLASASSSRFGGGASGYGEIVNDIDTALGARQTGDAESRNDLRSERRFGFGTTTTPARPVHHTPWLWYLAGALAAIVAAILLLKALVRAWGLRERDPRRRVAALRKDLESYALDQGVRLAPSLTHREFADRLGDEFGVDGRRWASAAEQVRFAPPERSTTAVRDLRFATKELRHDLRRTRTARDRAAGALSLRSVTERLPRALRG